MTLTYFLIYSLATWRIASLLVQEDGPGNVFRRLREAAGIEHDDNGDVYLVPDTFFAGVLSCIWCCSIWVAAGWTGAWLFIPEISVWLALPFGLSAGAIILDSWKKRVLKVDISDSADH